MYLPSCIADNMINVGRTEKFAPRVTLLSGGDKF
jgi:hypothetical protein